jgi:arylsulfatase A-like enzyme
VAAFDDSSTVATWLHDAGYRTSLVGKYLNGYGTDPFVPPGWDDWHAFIGSGYFDYRLVENGSVRSYGTADSDYLTDVLAAKAVDFIATADDRPFFLYFAPFAPHDPATPAPRHAGRFAGTPPWRPPAWNEADVSDKPTWLMDQPPLSSDQVVFADGLYERMLESLLAVDDAVAAILRALDEAGRTDDTVVVFTSDNGLSLGEHRVVGKQCPYDECLRVPLVVRYPRAVTAARTDSRLAANVDLAPTLAELAGTTPAGPVDGVSLMAILDGSASPWRDDLLAEQFSIFPPAYAAVRSARYKYVEYLHDATQIELYDLTADPNELTSRHADPAYAPVRAALAARLRALDPGWTQPVP